MISGLRSQGPSIDLESNTQKELGAQSGGSIWVNGNACSWAAIGLAGLGGVGILFPAMHVLLLN